MATKYCTVHYRKLNKEFFPDLTLAAAISNAMESVHSSKRKFNESWTLRVAPVPKSTDSRRFLNDFHSINNTAFGTLCHFTPGQMQALIKTADSAGEPIEKISTEAFLKAADILEDYAPEGLEYLHGVAYWLAVDDHFFIVQHTAIQTKAVEEYFTWFIRDETRIINAEHFVQLVPEFDVSAIGGELKNINSIEVGGRMPETADRASTKDEDEAKRSSFEVVERRDVKDVPIFEKARNVLELLVGPIEMEEIIKRIPQEAELDVRVNIGYRAKKRRFRKEFMNDIASGLRNLPDGELQIRSRDGRIKGKEARLQIILPFDLVRERSSLLRLDTAREQLIKAYTRFIDDGKITPNI